MPPKVGNAAGSAPKAASNPQNSSGSNSSSDSANRRSFTNVERLSQLPLKDLTAGDVAACLASKLSPFKKIHPRLDFQRNLWLGPRIKHSFSFQI